MTNPETALADAATTSESRRLRVPAPRSSSLRFLAVLVACGLCGAAVAAGGALLAAWLMKGRTTGIGDIVAVVLSMLAGFPLGVCAGLAGLRRLLRWPGSLPRGVAGALLGVAFVLLAAEPLRLNADSSLLLATYALCTAAFAAVGYSSRR